MVLNSITVILNCSYQHDFSLLYTSPGVVDWASIIEHWIFFPLNSLRFSAKILASNIEKSLNERQCLLFDLTSNEFSIFVQMLVDSSTSEKMVGTGFGNQYSASELLTILNNLLISKHNFSLSVQELYTKILVNLFEKIFIRGGNTERKMVCRILLKLMNNLKFKKTLEEVGMKNIISRFSDSNDLALKFLSQCIHLHNTHLMEDTTEIINHCICDNEGNNLSSLCMHFIEMIAQLCAYLDQILERFQGRMIKVSMKRFPQFKSYMEVITEINAFWKLSTAAVRSALGIALSSHSQYLSILHSFAMKIYRGMFIDN